MRLTRKAALPVRVYQWIKYECTVTAEPVYRHEESEWELYKSSDCADGYSITGSREYTYVHPDGKRHFAAAGGEITITSPNTGTVYYTGNNGLHLFKDVLIFDEVNGARLEQYFKTLTNIIIGYRAVYDIGDGVGFVYAAKGKYPDEKEGYTYVGLSGGYTIMLYGAGNYYAYKEVST